MNKNTLTDLMKLSHIPRWTIVDMAKEQSVADHTFRVMSIATYIIDELMLNGIVIDFTMDVFMYNILVHDMVEAHTGDTPSSHKNGNSFTEDNVKNDRMMELIISLADTVEAMIFLDRYAVRPSNVRRYLESKIQVLQHVLVQKLNVSAPTKSLHTMLTTVIDEVLRVGREYD